MKNDKKKKPSALKAGAWYAISDFLLKGIAILTTPIFTRILSKTQIGEYSNIVSWLSIIGVVVTVDLYSTINIAKYDFEGKLDEFIASITVLGTLITALGYLAVCLNQEFFVDAFGMPPYAIHLIFIYLLVSPAAQNIQGRYRAELNHRPIVLISVLSVVVSTTVAVILALIMTDGLKGRLYGTYLSLFAIDISIYIYILYKGKNIKIKYWKYALVIALPLAIHYLAGSIMNFSDRIMIRKICGAEHNALYSIAYSCAAIANGLRNALNAAWIPWSYEKINCEDFESLRKYSRYLLTLFGAVCLGMILAAPELMQIFAGKVYEPAKYVIPPVVVGYVCSMVYSFYGGIEMFNKKQNWFVGVAVISATVNVVLNYIFIPRYGYIAAAYTTLICLMLEALLHYLNVKRMKLAHYYDGRFNFWFLLFGIALIVPLNISYQYNTLRYSFGIIYLLVLILAGIKNKENIKNYLKMLV